MNGTDRQRIVTTLELAMPLGASLGPILKAAEEAGIEVEVKNVVLKRDTTSTAHELPSLPNPNEFVLKPAS
jgi:hypothetical protein